MQFNEHISEEKRKKYFPKYNSNALNTSQQTLNIHFGIGKYLIIKKKMCISINNWRNFSFIIKLNITFFIIFQMYRQI